MSRCSGHARHRVRSCSTTLEILGELIDKRFHQVDGEEEGIVGKSVALHLPLSGDHDVLHQVHSIDTDLIGRADHDVMSIRVNCSLVGGLAPDATARTVPRVSWTMGELSFQGMGNLRQGTKEPRRQS